MEKHDEQEITNLLTTIRAKRDLSTFGNNNQMKNGKVINPKPTILEEITELKPVENVQNSVTQSRDEADGTSRHNGEGIKGEIRLKKERSKTTSSKVKRSEMENELGQFLNKVQEAEVAEQYTFNQFKRYYVDDDIFQTLILLKNVGRIRNISVMINTIIDEFLEANQEDIETFLQSSKKKNR
jgi:hypothetical protein